MTRWKTRALGDLVTIVGGGTPTRANPAFYGGTIAWVTPKDMKSWQIQGSQITITQAGLDNSAARLVPPNSVLIVVRSGVLKHTIPVAVNRVPVAINQDMKALQCREGVDPNFIARFIKASSPVVLQWVRATTADNFPIDKLKALPTPLPPLSEQRRIAEVLDRAEALRAKRRAALAQLDTLTQSIFLDLFGDATNPQHIPTQSLGVHLLFITSGGRGWARFYAPEGKRFIRSLDVQMNQIGNEDVAFVIPPDNAEALRTRVIAGDVVLTITGSRIGRVAPIPADLEGAYVSQHVAILRIDDRTMYPFFLSFFLSLNAGGQRQIARAQYGQTKPGLNFEQIRRFQIPVPPLGMQREFARRVAAVEKLKAAQRASLAELDALFASLQHRAFRGEL